MGVLVRATYCLAIPLLLLLVQAGCSNKSNKISTVGAGGKDEFQPSYEFRSMDVEYINGLFQDIKEVVEDVHLQNPLNEADAKIRVARNAESVDDTLQGALSTNLGPVLHSNTELIIGFVCEAAQKFQEGLESTVSLAKRVAGPAVHPEFLEIVRPPTVNDKAFETAMARLTHYRAESSFLIDAKAIDKVVHDTKYGSRRLSLNERKALAIAKLREARKQINREVESILFGARYAANATFVGSTTVDYIHRTLTITKEYPKHMELYETPIKIGLAVSYELDCPKRNGE